MCTTRKGCLFELINEELRTMRFPEEFSDLSKFIISDERAAAFIRYMLNDDSYTVPDIGSEMYEVAQSRARHSAITYLIGLVFKPFKNIFDDFSNIVDSKQNSRVCHWLWLVTSLNHDKAYYSDYLKKEKLNYKETFKRFLLTDSHEQSELKFLNQFSDIFPRALAYSYDEILAYDQYATRYHMGEFDTDPKSKKKKDNERKDHGILGGIQLFHNLTRKLSDDEKKKQELFLAKICCLTIAQHNIFKSSNKDNDKNYNGYEVDGRKIDLSRIHFDSDFRISIETPLLLFLCLIDTIECVKKFSKGENDGKHLNTLTTLKSIFVTVAEDSIEIDLSKLSEEISKKPNLDNVLNKYKQSLLEFDTWTTFSVENQSNDVFRLTMRDPTEENNHTEVA